MRRSRTEPSASTGSTPHERVLEYEERLARRRAEARRLATEVEDAEKEAARIRAEADTEALEHANRQAEQILAVARGQAEQITADGKLAASELLTTAQARSGEDMAWVRDRVLPGRR